MKELAMFLMHVTAWEKDRGVIPTGKAGHRERWPIGPERLLFEYVDARFEGI